MIMVVVLILTDVLTDAAVVPLVAELLRATNEGKLSIEQMLERSDLGFLKVRGSSTRV